MKQSTFVMLLVAVCLIGVMGQAAADLKSLGGDAHSLTQTMPAPALMQFKKDKENIPRTFEEQPPLVPHTNDKYMINLTTNKCLDCHMKQEGKDEAKSVEMSESHFIGRDGKKLAKPSGGRHFCTQCHVPQVDAKPLVGTNFQAAK